MKAAIQSIILVVLMFATGNANSDNALFDEYGNQLIGIVYATCTVGVRGGRQFSEVSAVDRSDDVLPALREGSTCAEYTAELNKYGARVDKSASSCWASPFLTEDHRLCIAVFAALYG